MVHSQAIKTKSDFAPVAKKSWSVSVHEEQKVGQSFPYSMTKYTILKKINESNELKSLKSRFILIKFYIIFKMKFDMSSR